MSKNTLIRIEALNAGYLHGKEVRNIIRQMNTSVNKGELVGIIGQNGIGKSTLLRTIARLQKPLGGRIHIHDKNIRSYSRADFAKMISYVSTDTIHIQHCTVREFVLYGRFPYTNWFGKITQEDDKAVKNALEMVDLEKLADRFINEISDGERQRVMIARALAQDTPIILLDEPTAFLDMPNKFEVIHLLGDLSRRKNKTILFSSHDLSIAMKVADRLWLILPDEIIDGSPEDLVLQHSISKIFQSTRLRFDNKRGEFQLRRKPIGICYIQGDGNVLIWTKKAMERLGFETKEESFPMENSPENIPSGSFISINVLILESGGNIVWEATVSGKIYQRKSIYELCALLQAHMEEKER